MFDFSTIEFITFIRIFIMFCVVLFIINFIRLSFSIGEVLKSYNTFRRLRPISDDKYFNMKVLLILSSVNLFICIVCFSLYSYCVYYVQ